MTNVRTRWTGVQWLAILCVTLGIQGCHRDTPERFIASGKAYLEKRDFPAAVIQFKNAVQKAPNSAEARYLLGVALKEVEDPVSAAIEFRKAASAGYAPNLVYPALVHALIEQGQLEKALTEASEHQNIDAGKAELVALTGVANLGLGKLKEARSAFSATLSLEPANETAALGMAKVAIAERDLPRANQLVDEVLARTPSSRPALLLKGDLLVAGQRNKEAVQAYEKAIELRPRSITVYLSLVRLLVREGDLEEARERVEAIKKFAPKAPLTQYLDALVAYTQHDLSRARDAIQAALNAAPEHVPMLLLAGSIAYDSANYAQAEEYLRKVVGAIPNQPYPRRLLVLTYLRRGQLDRAREVLEPLLQHASNDAATLNLAGEVALANRDVAKAAEYYRSALALDPKNARTRTRLGQTRLAAGDAQQAIEDLEAASAADASQYQADVALVVLHLNRNELDKAQAAADTLAKKQPDNPLTYNLVGLVKLVKKDQGGARDSFERALRLQPTYFPAARNLANLDMRDGKPDAAKQRYEAILAKDGKNEAALLALAELTQQTKGSASEIEKAIDRAVLANPGSAEPRIIKVNYLLSRGDPKSALVAAQQAQAALPQHVQVLDALGRAQLAAGEYDQAIATFGKLSALVPKSPVPLLAQGDAYLAAKDWTRARQVIQKAVELQPDLAFARGSLVRVGILSGRFEEARAEARTIQKRWPTQAGGYIAEVEVLVAQKDWREAERVLRGAIEKTKDPTLAVRLYSLLDKQGQKKEAAAFASAWMAQNPKDIFVEAFAGELSMQHKDYAAAARWYKNVLKAQPDNAVVLNNLAWLLGRVQDPSALEYGEKALFLAPNVPSVLDTVGWLYVESGDIPRGLELLKKAHSLAPNTLSIQLNLAKALIKAGQGDLARQQLQFLAKLPTGSPIRDEAEKLLSTL
jgi:putative PEP-CTERM system TPR-repeat lipoprotein